MRRRRWWSVGVWLKDLVLGLGGLWWKGLRDRVVVLLLTVVF